ncbi:CHAT domain-containing protein [Salinirubrum litoreum]|uniref:CHAT domain-containing protein n=1 Tax=Salinirubrum litoreum TaxID=1126234 RepID=A0ABD5RH18_9EURY|nr:CHAT domain-containing protein [Salinirubrum litoreum]
MLTVAPLDARSGLTVHDRIEDVRFELLTDRQVNPRSADPDVFRVPVSTAAEITAERLTIPKQIVCYIRTHEGVTLAETAPNEETTLDAGRYELELTSLPFKLYAHVTGTFTIQPQDGHTQFSFAEPTTITLGFRSFHEQPAATVTTTSDPFDLMQAVSTLGSALKTTSPERSWPTLRGHPPLLERGAELSIPDGLEPPAENVHIEVPPTLDHIYRVTPLAYYLGAPIEAGRVPHVVADGRTLPLATADGDIEEGVQRTLEQTFFLDCLVRTEGLYELDLRERSALEDSLPFEPSVVYEQSLATRLQIYDEVPYILLEPEIPEWPICSDVRSSPETIEYLPFAANRLSHVRIADGVRANAAEVEPAHLGTFFRGETRGIARDAGDAATPAWDEIEFFEPPEADATTHAWVGDGYPLGTAKTDVDAITRRLERTTVDPDAITVQLVCNDENMVDETAGDLYGLRDLLDFEIAVSHDLTTAEFRELCHEEIDFLHYIGHVDDGGIVCADGSLDLRTLDTTGVRAFLLNACHSYAQGEALVQAGADGGIVTLSRVFNNQATKMGRLTARLLNHGFPLDATMSILDHGPLSSHRYAALGDYRTTICQTSNPLPDLIRIDKDSKDTIKIELYAFPSDRHELGKVKQPIMDNLSKWHLLGGFGDEYIINKPKAEEFLKRGSVPVLSGDEIYWSPCKIDDVL